MANLLSIARPYALAAFETAREAKELSIWNDFLDVAATMVNDKTVQKLLANPFTSSEKLFELFHYILSSYINTERQNFLLLLIQNKRLGLLPEISKLFHLYHAAFEKMSKVKIITAIQIEKEYKEKLSHSLSKRMGSDITLECEIDPNIIGGAIIKLGDKVIDGSIRGQLNRLREALSS